MPEHTAMVQGKLQRAWCGKMADGRYSMLVVGITGAPLWDTTFEWPMSARDKAEFKWAISQHGCDRDLLKRAVKSAIDRFPPDKKPRQETLTSE